ncbi:acyltransferase [Chloroflexota bacterium]
MDNNELLGTWDYRSLPPNIHIGNGCFLEYRGSFRNFKSQQDPGLIIGDRVRAFTLTTFGVDPSGFVAVGDDTVLVGAIIMCAQSIKIGARCVISYNVVITDSDFHPIDISLRCRDIEAVLPGGDPSQRQAVIKKPVNIGDDVWVGTGTIILKGVSVGNGAQIAPGSVISRNVPPGALVEGNPAVIIGESI